MGCGVSLCWRGVNFYKAQAKACGSLGALAGAERVFRCSLRVVHGGRSNGSGRSRKVGGGAGAETLVLGEGGGEALVPQGVAERFIQLEIHYLRDLQGQREVQVVELDRCSIGVHQPDADLFQIDRAGESDVIGEDRVAIIENHPLGASLHEDLGEALEVRGGGLLLHRVEIVDAQEEIVVSRGVDEGFGGECEGGVHDIEGFLVAEVIAQSEIIGTVFQTDHDEGEAERGGMMGRAWGTGRRSRPVVLDRGSSGDRVVLDTEE